MQLREPWKLIDSVRDACYDVFTTAEKQRLHDIVVKLKRTRILSAGDIAWLQQADANLRAANAISFCRWRRKGGAS